MDVSIIIPVHDDIRIERCVNSIDEEVEVIASMNNPTGEVEKIVRELGIKRCTIPVQSLSKAYNCGISTSTQRYVLFMDSDCIFEKGCIKRLRDNMGANRIARGRTVFSYNSGLSRIISRAREFTTSESPNLYIPLLMIDRSVFDDVGLFNEQMVFTSDCDFSDRVKGMGLPYFDVPTARIIHDPLDPLSDLRSAFRYGTGRSQKHRSRGHVKKPAYLRELRDYLIRGSKEKGLMTGLYLSLWYLAFTCGFLSEERNWKDV